MATDVSCPSNASSNGAPASAAAHPRPAWRLSKVTSCCLHFVLPDAHLPYVYRRGLKGWQDVELYDDWLRGAVLEDENPPEDEEGVDNEEEPEGDASRVMRLLLYVAPTRDMSEGFDGNIDINARRPLATQLPKFAALGWRSGSPSAAWVASELVRFGEDDLFLDRNRTDVVANGDTTCFSVLKYANFNPDVDTPARADGPQRGPSVHRSQTHANANKATARGAHVRPHPNGLGASQSRSATDEVGEDELHDELHAGEEAFAY